MTTTTTTLCFGATLDCVYLIFSPKVHKMSSTVLHVQPHTGQSFNSDRKYTNSLITLKYCYLYTLNLFQIKTRPPVFLMGHFHKHSFRLFQEVRVSARGTFECFLTGRQAETSDKCSRPNKALSSHISS